MPILFLWVWDFLTEVREEKEQEKQSDSHDDNNKYADGNLIPR